MWNTTFEGADEKLELAKRITANSETYGAAMQAVIKAWPRTMLNSLTNTGMNRRAFVGRCAMSYAYGIPEKITRDAWAFLTDEQRNKANAKAQFYINEYLKSL